MDFNPGSLCWGSTEKQTVANLMCTGPRYSHPLQRPLALERTRWETYSTLKCPASLWKAKGDLHAVLVWHLTLEFSCALHHDDIFLPTSQPSTGSALWRSFILSPKALRSCFSLSLYSSISTTVISQNPFLALTGSYSCMYAHIIYT